MLMVKDLLKSKVRGDRSEHWVKQKGKDNQRPISSGFFSLADMNQLRENSLSQQQAHKMIYNTANTNPLFWQQLGYSTGGR